jgi:hypothetical protein
VPDVHEGEADQGGQELHGAAAAKLDHGLVDVPVKRVTSFVITNYSLNPQ